MKKKHLILLVLTLALLTLTLVSCGRGDTDLDGKNIVTFELNGGTLDYQTSSSRTEIHFAYHPGTYVLDPSEIPGYKLYRDDYNFTGWYTSEECLPEEKWDFAAKTLDVEQLTLYAGWEKAIKHTFTVYYTDDEGNPVSLGEYRVKPGAVFNDRLNYAANRDGYTPLEYFSDAELETPWDSSFTHPGGEGDTDVPVYVSYLTGEWTLVSGYSQLKNAIKSGQNVYLTGNVDCGGEELSFLDGSVYNGIIEGNGYSVSNFTVTKTGTGIIKCAIFYTLGESAEIRNISFTGVSYIAGGVTATHIEKDRARISTLALEATGAKITNVTVSGTLTTDYEGEFPRLDDAVYSEESTASVSGFSANVTVMIPTDIVE